jgi:hypothetical protein
VNGTIPRPIRRSRLLAGALVTLAVAGFALAQTSPDTTITGQLTVPSGASFTGIRVVAEDPTANKVVQGTVDAAGKFTIMGATPGTYTVTAFGPGFAPQSTQNVQVVEGQSITQNITLAAREPVCVVKAAAPIALTEDFNSTAFADAPEILINTGSQIVEGLANINDYRGPTTLSGRLRMKYSADALHLAADIILPQPNVNFGSDTELWKGNALELLFQNDPYNGTRNEIDAMHNFRTVIALTDPPRWRFGNQLEQTAQLNNADVNIAEHMSVKNRAENNGNLVRANIPWAMFRTGGDNPTAIQPPQDNAMLALDLRINNTVPGATDASTADRQFQLAWSGLGGTEPRNLVPIQLCPEAPQ